MITVYHEAGRYQVCDELGEHFGHVVKHEPDLTDDMVDELPRIREFDLQTYVTVNQSLPSVLNFDDLDHITVNGRRSQ